MAEPLQPVNDNLFFRTKCYNIIILAAETSSLAFKYKNPIS